MPVLDPQPICDLLGIESNSAADSETRKLASRRHPVDVFVVHSQEFGQFGNLHCSVPGFEFLNQIETHAASSGSAVADCPFVEL
jgi:hypothetical protein